MERVLPVRKCEKTSAGGGGGGGGAGGNFQMEKTHFSLSVSFRKKTPGH